MFGRPPFELSLKGFVTSAKQTLREGATLLAWRERRPGGGREREWNEWLKKSGFELGMSGKKFKKYVFVSQDSNSEWVVKD